VPITLGFILDSAIDVEFEVWEPSLHAPVVKGAAMLILDTSEEFHLGPVREALKKVKESFYIDHHEPKPSSKLTGFVDASSSSTVELAVELACSMGIELDPHTAIAAYTGIVYDTGFFSYPKTSDRTFKAALKTMEWGAIPNHVYRQLMENSSCSTVLLQKLALSNLEFFLNRKVALMILRREDFAEAGAEFEEVENIVNIPLKAKEVEVSLLIREKETKEVFCSLRSKGLVNVSKIAQEFGGGGHVTASGFRRRHDTIEKIISKLLPSLESKLISENKDA